MYELDGFAKRLHDLRKQKGLTQEETAERLGVTAQAVSKWEKAQSYPDVTLFPQISAVLGASIDKLFGKTEPAYDPAAFPERYTGLPLVHQYGSIACYSEKTVVSADASAVKFADGSTAELSGRLIVNMGQGEIRLLAAEGIARSAEGGDEKETYAFPFADALDMEITCGGAYLTRSADEKTHVTVSGSGRFVRHHRISEAEGTLTVRCDKPEDLREENTESNQIQIALPCTAGRCARLVLNGKGSASLPLRFETGDLLINGSGKMSTDIFRHCKARINGSGDIELKQADEAYLTVNGSGDVSIERTEKLNVTINGSGDVKARSAAELSLQINGSGDFETEELRGGSVMLKINGSGNVDLKGGCCDVFDVKMVGSGDVDASSVTARKANIIIEQSGSVVLGRVLEGSTEQVKRMGSVKILNRGV